MFKKTITRHVERHTIRQSQGFYSVYSHTEQHLVETTTTFFSIKRCIVSTEIVPEDVLISLGCFGDTGGWRSAFAEYIK